MKERSTYNHFRIILSMTLAMGLLCVFVGWNYFLREQSLHPRPDKGEFNERECIPVSMGSTARRLAFHDFESGNANDTAGHLATMGHGGKQSLKMSSKVPFSPGLWAKFKDLNPGDSSWIRVTGYVWFSCSPAEAKCSLVATCNHNGINYKYMAIPVEKEAVKPNRWNRISVDYHIPRPPDPEDVLQAYFWYRGMGELLVDDIEVEYLTPLKH